MGASPLARTVAWFGAALFAASLAFFLYSYFVTFGRPAPPGGIVRPVLLNALLFGAFAAHHSALARTGAREAVRRAASPELERALYTTTASLLFLAVCSMWQPVPGVIYRLDGPWWWLGVGVQAAGVLLTCLGSAAIDPLDLAGVRQLRPRHGAPAHAPLRTTGIYGLVRHPIYFGWFLLVFGAPAMTGTRLSFAVLSTLYIAIAIPLEERALVETFGTEYRAYQKRVRSRMLPGLY